jgi:cell pole-organizing protein PopZ
MEEILSSIKKIIADDDRAKSAAPRRAAKPATAAKSSPAAEQFDDEHVLELTEAEDDSDGFDAMIDPESALLDSNKAQSLRHSFSTLQTLSDPGAPPQIVRSGETSLEGMVREMLKPMLKNWLDENLPNLVESMVEREIARITKKG